MTHAERLDQPAVAAQLHSRRSRAKPPVAAASRQPELPSADEFYAQVKRETPTIIAELAK